MNFVSNQTILSNVFLDDAEAVGELSVAIDVTSSANV